MLRSIEYGETSRIVTLYTRDRGKITVMARGARAAKSRFGAALQPMSYVQVVFYHKPGRELQTLSEAAHVRAFNDIGRSLEKMAVGFRIVDIAASLLEEERSPHIFGLLVGALEALNDTSGATGPLLPFFQMKLATALGFEPGFTRESVARLEQSGGVLSLESGEVFPAGTMVPYGHRASRSALRAFAICTRADIGPALDLQLDDEVSFELETLIDAYFRYHIGHAFAARSSRVFNQLMKPSPGKGT